ncbi:hypothetical protein ACP70R_036571 [Stipagrostis hirtigluma subsp. patula]
MAQGCLPSCAALFCRSRRGASGGGAVGHDAYALAARREEEGVEEYEAAMFEEEGLGPEALEARGDRFTAAARRRSSSRWFRVSKGGDDAALAVAHDFKEAALSYVLAANWRKAAPAFGNQAVQILKVHPDRKLHLHAAFALLRAARCYAKIPDKDKGELVAAKLGFEKAIQLYTEGEDWSKAATCCRELADFYEEQKEWHNALHYFEEAADYYGATTDCNGYYRRYCNDKARKMGCIIARAKLM